MSNPVLASLDPAGDRFYEWKGERFWSVTTLLDGGVVKYGLPPWYAKTVAELVAADILARGPHARAHAAIRRWAKTARIEVERRQSIGELTSIKLHKLTDRELALRFLKGEPVRLRDTAGETGLEVHDEAEELVLRLARETGDAWAAETKMPDWPDHLLGYMTSFVAFLRDWGPRYLATEATIFNRTQAYGGTLDAIIEVAIPSTVATPVWFPRPVGRPLVAVIDYKSGNRIHPEVAMQLAAYSRGEFIGSPDRVTELPLPRIDAGLVLHITPTGYALRPARIDDDVFEAFKFARENYRWGKETARTVLAPALTRPAREEEIA